MSNRLFVLNPEKTKQVYRAEMRTLLQEIVTPVRVGENAKRLIERADRALGFKDYSRTRRYWYGLARVEPHHLDHARALAAQRKGYAAKIRKAAENEIIRRLLSDLDVLAERIAVLEAKNKIPNRHHADALRNQAHRLRNLNSRR
jgi:hypothetical protein